MLDPANVAVTEEKRLVEEILDLNILCEPKIATKTEQILDPSLYLNQNDKWDPALNQNILDPSATVRKSSFSTA